MYILQSKTDNGIFNVDQKVIDASALLKNVCELTEITEPIIVNCSSVCLSTFINLINHYDSIDEDHDVEFEKIFFAEFDDGRLIGLVREMCVLDSDFFLDSVADLILDRVKEMNWQQIQEYFQLDSDYSEDERKIISENTLEYLLSIDVGILKFPFPDTRFTNLKNKFSTPMNALLARIVQRSNSRITLQLSLINKALKNENDRHPIKVKEFHCFRIWLIQCEYGGFILSTDKSSNSYFYKIKSRKIVPEESVHISYDSPDATEESILRASSMDFVIPSKTCKALHVEFSQNLKQIYDFDVKKCPFSSIFYEVFSTPPVTMNFKEFFNQLIAQDFTKEIRIRSSHVFGILDNEHLQIYKKPNASRFHKIEIQKSPILSLPECKKFVLNYMETDGLMYVRGKLFDIPDSYDRKTGFNVYVVSDVIDILNLDPNEVYCRCKAGCKANSRCKCRRMERICNSRCHFDENVLCSNE